MKIPMVCAAVAAGLACAPTAHAQVFTFDSLVHGEILTNQFEPTMAVTGFNYRRPHDIIAGFDTSLTNTADPDLQGPPWSGGNLAIDADSVALGTALIIAQDDTDANGDGILDNPDDEGLRPAGRMELDFASPIPVFGLDIIDIEGRVSEQSRLVFFVNGSAVARIDFGDFEDPSSAYYDPTVQFGNNTANRIQPIPASDFGYTGFDRVIIYVGGSSAYDTFVIPAPASGLLVGLVGLGLRRRR